MEAHAHELVARRFVSGGETVRLELRQLRGGLESAVSRVVVRQGAPVPASQPRRFVMKELRGTHRREALVYRTLWSALDTPPAARVFDSMDTGGASYLCLEDVPRASAWPWRDFAPAAAVCTALANLHDARIPEAAIPAWDYERELQVSAEATLELVSALPARQTGWGRGGDLKRVVTALPEMRARLLADGVAMLHGDVHPGNVMVRPGEPPHRVTFIDWARARFGSPLEDVASWLHSLGCWDLEMRRRHDSLLRWYLQSRRPMLTLDAACRERYWLASACNGLAGAIRYHVSVIGAPDTRPRARRDSMRALAEWQRVIRGAARLLASRQER